MSDKPPELQGISPDQTIGIEDLNAEIVADGVDDDSASISRVWGVVTPPRNLINSLEEAVADLESFELIPEEDGSYTGEFRSFAAPGEYFVDTYALDSSLNLSQGRRTTVTKGTLIPGTLAVSVFSDEVVPIEGALVSFAGPTNLNIESDGNGFAFALNLDPGTWTVTAEVDGYNPQSAAFLYDGSGVQNVDFTFGESDRPEEPTGCGSLVVSSSSNVDGAVLLTACLLLILWGRSGQSIESSCFRSRQETASGRSGL